MASFFASPPFLSHPVARSNYVSSVQTSPPQSLQPQQLSANTEEPPKAVGKRSGASNPAAKTTPDSTDWIASTLTRRFGIGAGLAWIGFLAAGVVSEQIKTRFEASQQEANTRDIEKQEEVVLPNGIRYTDLRVGGGAFPRTGDLVVMNIKGSVQGSGQVFVDTFRGDKKPLALVMGSRPYSKGICEGIEYVLASTKAGGKRRVTVPSSLGFGENGADLSEDLQIPPYATLEYVVEVEKVSIAPA